jgi:hypothetical protein
MRHTVRKYLEVFLLFSLFPSIPILANTYYVSWTMGSDLNNGYTGCPSDSQACKAWKSLQRVTTGPADGYKPGDVIVLRMGDSWDLTDASNHLAYGGINILGIRIDKSGTSGNPITYRSSEDYGSGSLPIFDCKSPGAGTTCTAIYGAAKNYIRIDGIRFQNLGTHDNSYDNAVLIEGANYPNLGGGSNNWEIVNCIVVSSNQAFNIQGNGHVISKNVISGITHSGIYSYNTSLADGANNVVQSNDVGFCNYNGIDLVGATNRNWTLNGNYVHDSNNAIELSGTSYSIIFNNICYNNHSKAGPYANSLGCIALVNQASYNRIYHNTAYANDYGIVLQLSTTSLHNEVRYNILAENSVAELYIFNEIQRTQNTFDTNLYFNSGAPKLRFTEDGGLGGGLQTATWWSSNVDANGIYADPKFINASSIPHGLGLGATSPAIDKAPALPTPFNRDYEDNVRPSGVAADLGALEYNSSVPRNLRIIK